MANAATARHDSTQAGASPGNSASHAGERYPIVDVLRGVSILLVILLHVQLRISLEPDAAAGALPHALWRLLCRNGNEGVRIFFVISGFLITSTALQRWGALHGIHVRRFYGLRLARIAPSLAVLLVVLGALHLVGAERYTIDPRVGLGRALVAAATFHVNWLEASRSLYLPASWDVLWSLGIEEAFYLFFPLLCLAYRWPLGGHALLFGLVVAGASVRCALVDQPMWQSKSYFACVDGIALGCLTAALTHGRRLPARVIRALAAGGAVLALAVLLVPKGLPFLALTKLRLHLTLLSLASAGLLVAATRLSLGPRLLALLRPLRACGRLSYEIYLTHMFVVLAAAGLYEARGWPRAAAYPLVVLICVACWALAALVERYLSSPANRWLRATLGSTARGGTRTPAARPTEETLSVGR